MPSNTNINLVSTYQTDDYPQISQLLSEMTLEEKVGQMSQFSGFDGELPEHLTQAIRAGRVGSVLNEVNLQTVNELQRIAVEESRLGIPLLIGRDVIHGFKTVFPIPLAQAASWCPKVVEQSARIAAIEASASGVNWTFAPMIDISRDPRWGRIAESLGEDPHLCATLGAAMVKGFQGQNLSEENSIAACAKHFAGYGAAESGRDYNTANIPENELRNVYLPPFKMAAEMGVASFMASFSDLNGVPATGNQWLMDDILRQEWGYQGLVVSDWESIYQLRIHGYTENDKESAFEALNAGIDMEMVSTTYLDNAEALLAEERITMSDIDTMVNRILRLKYQLGLFDNSYKLASFHSKNIDPAHLTLAKEAAIKSCVLLKNDHNGLPLQANNIQDIALIGPLADDSYEQLGTWIFDGDENYSVSCLQALKKHIDSDTNIRFEKGLATSRSNNQQGFARAVEIAAQSNIAIMVMGEESILSGEAHCRADLNLPGAQEQLIDAVAATGTPIVLVIMAGRPLALESVLPKVESVLYAWHPGTMAGPAITDLLFGAAYPSGKLPVTFPRKVGQIPLYYAQKHTGKPATEDSYVHIDAIPVRAKQTSLGMAASHLDTHFSPLFHFGFGLSYSEFSYHNIRVDKSELGAGETLFVSADLSNNGDFDCEEIVQLYIRDLVGSVTRPIKELKGYQRIFIKAGQTLAVQFELNYADLSFYDRNMQFNTEPGRFQVWIGGCSQTQLQAEFKVH